jgi:flagellar hook protein FlgE
MLRSMNSAISGLKNHQVFMDVIGNNVANVNTTGFKASRTTFSTMLSQTLRGAVSPTVGRGGTNAIQIGLGSAVAGVDLVNTQGAFTTTSKLTDLAIQGDGFFLMTDGIRKFYTRDGAFDLSADASLISPSTGLRVMGWNAVTDAQGNTSINNAQAPLPITIPIGQSVTARPTHTVSFNGNLNGAPTDTIGSAPVESTVTDGTIGFNIASTDTLTFTYKGQVFTTAALAAATKDTTTLATVAADLQAKMNTAAGLPAGTIKVTALNTPSALGEAIFSFQAPGELKFGNLVSSNTALNAALKGRSSKGLESMATTMTVYDSLGNGHDVTIRFDKVQQDETGAAVTNTWKWAVAGLDPGTTIDNTGSNGAGFGYLKFDSDGKMVQVYTLASDNTTRVLSSSAAVTFNYTNGASPPNQTVRLDFSQITQLQDGDTAAAATNDGFATGTLLSFVVGQDGVITGSYSNGVSQVLGQIALATFPNVGGLLQVSQNLFTESANSGIPNIGAPGTSSRGTINAGQLESSNVDLAQQFTDMIRAERGFQANSRIVTTSDEMLQDLVNLKR